MRWTGAVVQLPRVMLMTTPSDTIDSKVGIMLTLDVSVSVMKTVEKMTTVSMTSFFPYRMWVYTADNNQFIKGKF